MFRASEILTVLGAGVSVMGLTLAATLYVGGTPSKAVANQNLATAHSENRRAYDISDAVYPCQDHIQTSIPFHVRNVNVDSRSSRYDEGHNAYIVYLDLEVVERPGNFYNSYNYTAQIECSVSAANNEVLSFKVSRV